MIRIKHYERDGSDFAGKSRDLVFCISVNNGPDVMVSRPDLIKAILMNLPEGEEQIDLEPLPKFRGNGEPHGLYEPAISRGTADGAA
jgi:hypothetical protein